MLLSQNELWEGITPIQRASLGFYCFIVGGFFGVLLSDFTKLVQKKSEALKWDPA